MSKHALGAIAALALLTGLGEGPTAAQAADYVYGGYDEPETVITRRTIIERRVVRPERVVREVLVERPVVVAPRRIVREVVEERPVAYRPPAVIREEFIERDGFYGPRPLGTRPVGYGYGRPDFDPYD